MSDNREDAGYIVGYRNPPKNRQFRKGVSGNPSGRPKKAPDFESQLLRELNSVLTINENGNRRVIKKHEGIAKQLVNKALSGNLPATRLLVPLYQQALERKAEERQRALDNANRTIDELSDEELTALIRADQERSTPNGEDSR